MHTFPISRAVVPVLTVNPGHQGVNAQLFTFWAWSLYPLLFEPVSRRTSLGSEGLGLWRLGARGVKN